MIKNTYILHINDPRSLQYLDDCLQSCKTFPDINPIPVEGYNGVSYKDICGEFGINIIPYYVNMMDTSGDTVNRAFSCTAGHIKIWQMIVASGELGAVLEHDAIVKGPLSMVDVNDNEILWLGPRIEFEDDYKFPNGAILEYVEVDRWEGTHAYAITPKTAQSLLDSIKKYGLNDSIDGQLGMRNMFDMNFTTINPPVAVAVVGNRESCIETHGNPGFWNAYHSDQFLKNLRPECNVPPIRKLLYTDTAFNTLVPALEQVLKGAGKLDGREQSVLVQGGYEGLSSVWLSNKLLQHDESYMQIVSEFKNQNEANICAFNTYFSKYYYKLNIVSVSSGNKLFEQAVEDTDIRFDVIFSDDNMTHDSILLWHLLKDDGILIINGGDAANIENIIDAVNPIVICNFDEFVALKKI